ncbi:hypothetical protein [Microvenator marinus]|nr:hypothetical protein [Microvenator marinus]
MKSSKSNHVMVAQNACSAMNFGGARWKANGDNGRNGDGLNALLGVRFFD